MFISGKWKSLDADIIHFQGQTPKKRQRQGNVVGAGHREGNEEKNNILLIQKFDIYKS